MQFNESWKVVINKISLYNGKSLLDLQSQNGNCIECVMLFSDPRSPGQDNLTVNLRWLGPGYRGDREYWHLEEREKHHNHKACVKQFVTVTNWIILIMSLTVKVTSQL